MHVEDSLNSAGLLASTTLLLMPACKSNGWSPFRLQTPPLSKRTPMSAESTSSVEVDRVVIKGDDVPARFRCEKVHCVTVGELIFRDRYISTQSRTWTFHCRQ